MSEHNGAKVDMAGGGNAAQPETNHETNWKERVKELRAQFAQEGYNIDTDAVIERRKQFLKAHKQRGLSASVISSIARGLQVVQALAAALVSGVVISIGATLALVLVLVVEVFAIGEGLRVFIPNYYGFYALTLSLVFLVLRFNALKSARHNWAQEILVMILIGGAIVLGQLEHVEALGGVKGVMALGLLVLVAATTFIFEYAVLSMVYKDFEVLFSRFFIEESMASVDELEARFLEELLERKRALSEKRKQSKQNKQSKS